MKKVVLFDLYDTVLKDISFDFSALYLSFRVKRFVDPCALRILLHSLTTIGLICRTPTQSP